MEKYKIINAEKVGKVVLHIMDKDIGEEMKGKKVHVHVDESRRS